MNKPKELIWTKTSHVDRFAPQLTFENATKVHKDRIAARHEITDAEWDFYWLAKCAPKPTPLAYFASMFPAPLPPPFEKLAPAEAEAVIEGTAEILSA